MASNVTYQVIRPLSHICFGSKPLRRIYECNQNCSCAPQTCYNRVVQNGIQLRLQVFMTENRGWGLRCIDDIPKGAFICTYTGQVLNEQTANREGDKVFSFFFFFERQRTFRQILSRGTLPKI